MDKLFDKEIYFDFFQVKHHYIIEIPIQTGRGILYLGKRYNTIKTVVRYILIIFRKLFN